MHARSPQRAEDGLTDTEAQSRLHRGESKSAVGGATRSYATILRSNVFSFYNTILFVIGLVLLSLSRYNDAFITVGMGLLNAVISAAQEVRAKRKLDRLQVIHQASVVVVRSGRDLPVLPTAVVAGDVLVIRPGDQIVVDGPLLQGERVVADESLLTGEAEPVIKRAHLDDDRHDRLVERTTVFGRILPEQKERIVLSLRRQGHYVAMIGDGANDARALKAAQVGIAMRSGSAITRGVADVVLLDDSFAALLPARRAGRRIINGIAISMHIYLARVAAQGLVIVAVTMLGLGFPYSPNQVGLTLLTVGVPTLFLTFWATPEPPDGQLLGTLAHFVVPAAVVTAGFGTAVYAVLYRVAAESLASGRPPAHVVTGPSHAGIIYGADDFATASSTIIAQNGLSTFIGLTSFLLILFLAPPGRIFAAWTIPTSDRRPALLVAGLLIAFAAVLFIPVLHTYFGPTGPTSQIFGTVLPAVVLWFATLSLAY